MDNNRSKGSRYENEAAAFLENKGIKILDRNFRCRLGEIDII
ncbi:MAG: YraN family protein, partial [Lachnospiraceae bacterium]|nr:YraN family protein [Lachnospiraceae bacterium]